jgi:hypothetical protein
MSVCIYQEWIRAEQGFQQEPAAYQRSVRESRDSGYTGAIHGKVHVDHFVHRLNNEEGAFSRDLLRSEPKAV